MTLAPEVTLAGEGLAAWQDYRRWNREKKYSPHTIRGRGDTLGSLQLYLDAEHPGLTILTAGRDAVSAYLVSVGDEHSAGTQLFRHRCLRGFFNFCAAEGIITESPMTGIGAPEAAPKMPRVYSDAEIDAILATCKAPRNARPHEALAAARDEAIIRIFCEPGSPRLAEMAGMRVDDFNMDADVITLRGKRHKGAVQVRLIAMSQATARAVSRYLRLRARVPGAAAMTAMWISLKGGFAAGGIFKMTARRGRLAGVKDVHPHGFRHTAFADFDAATGGHLNAEMALFGWNSSAMPQHYGRSVREAAALETARQLARGNRFGGRA